eukprot:1443699-Prymnesium_polylepis.1
MSSSREPRRPAPRAVRSRRTEPSSCAAAAPCAPSRAPPNAFSDLADPTPWRHGRPLLPPPLPWAGPTPWRHGRPLLALL